MAIVHIRRSYWQTRARAQALRVWVDNLLKPYYCPWQQRYNHGFFAVNIRAEVGFFAQLNWCIYVFAHCKQLGLKPAVTLSSPFYTCENGDNWLAYYFDGPAISAEGTDWMAGLDVKVSHVSTIRQLGFRVNYGEQMTLDRANHLFKENLFLKEEVRTYIDRFVEGNFATKRVVGVHFRGTDKSLEASPVSFDHVARTVNEYLHNRPETTAIFVASDEGSFIDKMCRNFDGVEVICHPDSLRSSDGSAIHTQQREGDNYLKGRDALVNCLLLSRCDTLIRTASFLSGWSSVFNPSLPVIMLNRPYEHKTWFPDSVILENATLVNVPNDHAAR